MKAGMIMNKSWIQLQKQEQAEAISSTATSAGSDALWLGSRSRHWNWLALFVLGSDLWSLDCLLLRLARFGCLGRSVPVVQNLQCNHQVQGEPGNVSVEDQRVVDLLQGGKDAGQRSNQEVKYLGCTISIVSSENQQSYRKRAQLSCSTLFPDRKDLWKLASHAHDTGTCL
jgi:hypothetical protein